MFLACVNAVMAQRRMAKGVLGLKWETTSDGRPTKGEELTNAKLVQALTNKQTEFTLKQWDAFGINDLREDQFVKSGNHYFKPVVRSGDAARSASGDLRVGMKWEEIGLEEPKNGSEITESEGIKEQFKRGKLTFSREEVGRFQSTLSYDSYIKVGSKYFVPVEEPCCKFDILNDCCETEDFKDRIEVRFRQPVELRVGTVRLLVRRLEILGHSEPAEKQPPRSSLMATKLRASMRGGVSSLFQKTALSRVGMKVGDEDWSWWKQALDWNAMNTMYMQRAAEILNRPYASDLDPWISDGGITTESSFACSFCVLSS